MGIGVVSSFAFDDEGFLVKRTDFPGADLSVEVVGGWIVEEGGVETEGEG